MFKDFQDFINRISGIDITKRAVESFIKAGVFDCFKGNRHQKLLIYENMMDGVSHSRKNNIKGQMSLFDFFERNDDIQYPDVEEYEKDKIFAFEKEVIGFYISGHPLEDYEKFLKKHTNITTLDFYNDESNKQDLINGEVRTIGGIILSKTIKYTKNNEQMAFITLEDLYGTIEIIVFPSIYEKNKDLIEIDNKVIIKGKVSVEEDKASKLICIQVLSFDSFNRELWIRVSSEDEFVKSRQKLFDILGNFNGNDTVFIYCECEKTIKQLKKTISIKAERDLITRLETMYSKNNIKII